MDGDAALVTRKGTDIRFLALVDGKGFEKVMMIPLDHAINAAALSGDITAMGCTKTFDRRKSGCVYIYERDGVGSWSRAAHVRPGELQTVCTEDKVFGITIAIESEEEKVAVGVPINRRESYSGAAFD